MVRASGNTAIWVYPVTETQTYIQCISFIMTSSADWTWEEVGPGIVMSFIKNHWHERLFFIQLAFSNNYVSRKFKLSLDLDRNPDLMLGRTFDILNKQKSFGQSSQREGTSWNVFIDSKGKTEFCFCCFGIKQVINLFHFYYNHIRSS